MHPPGLAILLAPLALPFRGTPFVESMALIATAGCTIAGMFAFMMLIRPYLENSLHAVLIGGVAYLGSPLWHYGRTLYVEPYAATLIICAYAQFLRQDRFLLTGFLIGIAVLLKMTFVIFLVPILIDTMWQRRWAELARFAAPIVISLGIIGLWNVQMRDGWLHGSLKWEWGHPIGGILGLLLSPQHGILLVAPILVGVLWCARPWFKYHPRDAVIISSAIVLFWGAMGSYSQWWGGTCYSARYLVPVLPLLFVPLAMLASGKVEISRHVRTVVSILIVFSLVFGGIAAFACEHVWGKHPLQLLAEGGLT